MRILRGLTSRLLSCGCLAGVYETYDGLVVMLIDERGAACGVPTHAAGNEVPDFAISPDSEVALQADGQRKS